MQFLFRMAHFSEISLGIKPKLCSGYKISLDTDAVPLKSLCSEVRLNLGFRIELLLLDSAAELEF